MNVIHSDRLKPYEGVPLSGWIGNSTGEAPVQQTNREPENAKSVEQEPPGLPDSPASIYVSEESLHAVVTMPERTQLPSPLAGPLEPLQIQSSPTARLSNVTPDESLGSSGERTVEGQGNQPRPPPVQRNPPRQQRVPQRYL